MNKALDETSHAANAARMQNGARADSAVDWRKKASDHIAYGLLVYTGLHIFVTMTQLKSGNGSLLPYFALVVLVAAIIPACRWMEMRWNRLTDSGASDAELRGIFIRDMVLFWLAAIGLPLGLTFTFKTLSGLF